MMGTKGPCDSETPTLQADSLSESENVTLLQTWGTVLPHLLVINTYGQS